MEPVRGLAKLPLLGVIVVGREFLCPTGDRLFQHLRQFPTHSLGKLILRTALGHGFRNGFVGQRKRVERIRCAEAS